VVFDWVLLTMDDTAARALRHRLIDVNPLLDGDTT
jgi:hypothetical protein